MKKGISIVGLKNIEEVRKIAEGFPSFYFELSYAMNKAFLDEVYPYIKGRTSSLHALSPRREYFPNFGSSKKEDIKWSEQMLLEDSKTAIKFGADVIVLHPGYMADDIIPSDNEKRMRYFSSSSYNDYIAYSKGSICNSYYLESSQYKSSFNRMLEETERLSSKMIEEGLHLALENLNPRAGYLLIHPDEMIRVSKIDNLFLTLDIGHLWVTSQLFNLDFLGEIRRIMDTNKVVNVHLHSNPSDKKKQIFQDSHESLDKYALPYKAALDILKDYDANLILEVLEEPERNAFLLSDYLV